MSAFNFRIYQVVNLRVPDNLSRCSSRNCRQPFAYLAQYDYVTGRAGRVSTSDRWFCEQCGRQFMARNGIKASAGKVDFQKYYLDRRAAFLEFTQQPLGELFPGQVSRGTA